MVVRCRISGHQCKMCNVQVHGEVILNTFVHLPKAATLKKETTIQVVKERLMDVTREYAGKEGREHTLSRSESQGIESLLKRSKEGELVVMETDKSGKFTVMGQQDYIEAGYEHVQHDREIDEKELKAIERRLNAASSMYIKIFRVGEDLGHTERHRSNYITHSANASNMKMLHKDHKGPGSRKMRRLNGPGFNETISNQLADLLEPIAGEMRNKAEKGSTESVLSEADTYNNEVSKLYTREICELVVNGLLDGVVGLAGDRGGAGDQKGVARILSKVDINQVVARSTLKYFH